MHDATLITDAALPGWPPPAGEPIGADRARAYVAWIAHHARPLIAEARRMLRDRYPGVSAGTSSVTIAQLASWTVSGDLPRLNIGMVWCEPTAGAFAMVDINIRRDGRLEMRPGLRMRDR